MAATIAVDSTYATPALRELVARAAANNRVPPPELRSYRGHVETELSLLLRDTLGREHTSQVEQLASLATWKRSGEYALHVVGYRSQSAGVPYSALSIVRAWTVPSLYGERLSLGAYFNESKRRKDTLIAVHPFAADRDRYYRFSGGDTVTVLRVGQRRIPIVHIQVRPKRAGEMRLAVFQGEIDLDVERAQIVRMRGRIVTMGGPSSAIAALARVAGGVVAVAYVEFVNAEVDGAYWLPTFQRTEFQAGFAALGQTRPIFRIVSSMSDIAVTRAASMPGDSTAKPLDSLRVTLSWAPSDSVGRYDTWVHGLGTQSGSVHADDFIDLAPDRWRRTGPPRFDFYPNTTSRIVRFNRVEGLFTGIAPSLDFRSAAPGLTVGANGGWAWAEKTARAGAFVRYGRGPFVAGGRVERTLASTNDFVLPLSGDMTIAALLTSADNADYVDRRSAMVSLTRVLGAVDVGLATIQAGVASDRAEVRRVSRGLLRGSGFRENRGITPGRYAIVEADLEVHPNVTGDYVQPGVGLRAHYEVASGDLRWRRTEVSLSGRRYLGPVTLLAHADGGMVFGNAPPPQQLFELGGDRSLPGYEYKQFVGDRAALFRTFASYRFNLWRRPVRVWRSFRIPGLSPGLAVSAQGAWSELSSPGARAAVRILGMRDGVPVGEPTNGMRATIGGGFTFFGDLVHVGLARPVDRSAPWRFSAGFAGGF